VKAICSDPAYKDKTIGIISLLSSSDQAKKIKQQIDQALVIPAEEVEARKLTVGDSYQFQGDERDIMILSLVKRPTKSGRPLSSLTTAKDERRYNVAVSRAKEQLFLFHSVGLEHLNPKCIRYKLLDYCLSIERKTSAARSKSAVIDYTVADRAQSPPGKFSSWLQVDIYNELAALGYRVLASEDVTGYLADLVVEGTSGRLIIECLTDKYEGTAQFQERFQKQRDLKRCQMPFHYVRGSSFYLDRSECINNAKEALHRVGIEPTGG